MKYTFGKIAINSTAKKKPTEEDKYHYIGLEHLSSDTFDISNYGSDVAPTGEKLIMQKGDILFGKRRAYQKKVGISPIDGIFSAHGFVLRPRKEIINPEYFPFFIASNQFLETAIRISVGGLSPTVNWKDLEKQEFDLPSLSEQKILAEKLWAAYHLKESYKKMIEATDEMVKSRFIEMFGGKSTSKLGEMATIIMGQSPDSKYYNDKSEGLPFYQGKAEFSDKYIGNPNTWCTMPTRLSEKNDILMSVRAPVGAVNIATEQCCIGRGLCAIRPKVNITSTEYLFYAILINEKKIASLGIGSTFQSINKEAVFSLSFPLPSIEEQERFSAIVKQADKSKFELREAIKRVESMMKSLMN